MSDHVHRWDHSINWSHAILGLALIVVAVEFGDTLAEIGAGSDMDARDGAEKAASVLTN